MAITNLVRLPAITVLCVAVHMVTSSTRQEEVSHIKQLAQASNRFALHLYQTIANENENVFFSPLSISTALAMTFLGARERTAEQMAKVLQFNTLEESRLHLTYSELNTAIFGGNKNKYVLRTANRLFGHVDLKPMQEFLSAASQHYGSDMASLDFTKDAEGSRNFINFWVERETGSKITTLFPPGSINALTRLVLVNAIYFKADWVSSFDSTKTHERIFHVSERETVLTSTMHRKSKYPFWEDVTLRCKLLELPYVGRVLSMVVILPDEVSGLDRLRTELTNDRLQQLLGRLSNVTIEVALPKFRLEESILLNKALSKMGMEDIFIGGKADLSGITGASDLYVSSVVHKAFLEVNEEGSEAAAATGVSVSKRSIDRSLEFVADHPFLFLIMDVQTRTILFMGHYRNPGEKNSTTHAEL